MGEGEAQRGPTEQELRDALNRIKVSDVLIETMQGLASLGYHKLAPDSRDLEQTRLAIEALKALNATLEGAVPAELTRDFNQAIANLQLAFASAAAKQPEEDATGADS